MRQFSLTVFSAVIKGEAYMYIIFPLVFLAGFVDSIAGGGGIIAIASYFAIGLPPHMALGTNKFSAVFGSGIAVYRYWSKGFVHVKAAIIGLVSALIGSAIGTNLVILISERTVQIIVLTLLPIVAVFLLLNKNFGEKTETLQFNRLLVLAAATGFFVGMYDGFFGPGTGTFLIIANTLFLKLDIMTANANSKVVNFASNLASVVTFSLHGNVNFKLGIPCAICCILGSYLGSGLALKNGIKIVKPMIVIMLILLMIKICYDFLTV
jgi:uncharacterized membrane protein YfcA